MLNRKNTLKRKGSFIDELNKGVETQVALRFVAFLKQREFANKYYKIWMGIYQD